MEKKSSNILPFLIGAAVGAAVGYLIASGKAEEILADLKEKAGQAKDELEKQIKTGKEIIDALTENEDSNA